MSLILNPIFVYEISCSGECALMPESMLIKDAISSRISCATSNLYCHSIYRFEISVDKNREAIPFKEVITAAKDGIYLHFRDLCSNKN